MMMMLRRYTTRDKLGCCCLLPLKNLVAPFHTRKPDPNEYTRKKYEKLLQQRPLPPLKRFNNILRRFNELGLYPAVLSLNKQMLLHGIARDEHTLSILVSCYCRLKQFGFGLSVMGNIFKMGCQLDPVALNSLVNQFLLENKVAEAEEIFTKLLRGGHYKPTSVSPDTFLNLMKGMGITNSTLCHFLGAVLREQEARGIEILGVRPDCKDCFDQEERQAKYNMLETLEFLPGWVKAWNEAWTKRKEYYANLQVRKTYKEL